MLRCSRLCVIGNVITRRSNRSGGPISTSAKCSPTAQSGYGFTGGGGSEIVQAADLARAAFENRVARLIRTRIRQLTQAARLFRISALLGVRLRHGSVSTHTAR